VRTTIRFGTKRKEGGGYCHAPLGYRSGGASGDPSGQPRITCGTVYILQVEPHSSPSRIRLTSILLSILILSTPTYKPLTQLYNAYNKANIVAPTKGSKEVTVTLSNAIEEAADKGSFKDNFNNNYNSID
jgi:hypothetical protein